MWPANQTRSDIANAVRAVARYTNLPSEVHGKTAVGILEFVFSTSDFGITFQIGSELELIAYADADYASTATDRRWGCAARGGMRVLVFEDSKVRDAFDHRSRVRSTGRPHQGHNMV